MGPPLVRPNSFRINGGIRRGSANERASKKLRASRAELRKNSNAEPCSELLPDRVMMSVKPAAPRPISAGIHPELDRISCTASTFKFVNVAPPISGSVLSAPSMANTAAVPRWPFTANCCVKFAAPLVSVIVPAASNSSWLKSRLFNGREETALPESCSPPVLSREPELCARDKRPSVETWRIASEPAPGSCNLPDEVAVLDLYSTEIAYSPGTSAAKVNRPSGAVVAVWTVSADCKRTVAAAIELPSLSRSTPDQGLLFSWLRIGEQDTNATTAITAHCLAS